MKYLYINFFFDWVDLLEIFGSWGGGGGQGIKVYMCFQQLYYFLNFEFIEVGVLDLFIFVNDFDVLYIYFNYRIFII